MKSKLMMIITGLALVLLLPSCIKQIDKRFTGTTVVEIDPTVLNSANSIAGYPVLTRVPNFGVPSATSDSTLRRLNGRVLIRLNLVGPQSETPLTVGYKVMTTSPLTTISFPATVTGQLPSMAAGTLAVSNAVAGTHYQTLSGTCSIPPRSSFGFIEVNTILGSATAGQARFLGIQLDSTGTVLPNPNYNKIGLVFDQR
ncbi:MAG: hypothetical protein ACK5G0_01670 [Bacteroidota bacterium]|jgi:hypothetical protein